MPVSFRTIRAEPSRVDGLKTNHLCAHTHVYAHRAQTPHIPLHPPAPNTRPEMACRKKENPVSTPNEQEEQVPEKNPFPTQTHTWLPKIEMLRMEKRAKMPKKKTKRNKEGRITPCRHAVYRCCSESNAGREKGPRHASNGRAKKIEAIRNSSASVLHISGS